MTGTNFQFSSVLSCNRCFQGQKLSLQGRKGQEEGHLFYVAALPAPGCVTSWLGWRGGTWGRDITEMHVAKIKAMFSEPEPLGKTLIFSFPFSFNPELTHVSVSPSAMNPEKERGVMCLRLQLQTSFLCSGSLLWASHADGVMAAMPPFLSLKEVPSRHISSRFMSAQPGLKAPAFLPRRALSASSSIAMSFSILHSLSHSSSSERVRPAFLYEPAPFLLESHIRSDF